MSLEKDADDEDGERTEDHDRDGALNGHGDLPECRKPRRREPAGRKRSLCYEELRLKLTRAGARVKMVVQEVASIE